MPTTILQNTTNSSKPKSRCNNQTSSNWHASKSSCVMLNDVPMADHSRNSRPFLDSKQFVCSTCQKCVFNANHDACVKKFLKEVNSHAKVQYDKTRNSNKPVEQKSHTQKPKPTGRICKTIGLRCIPTGKLFDSCMSKVDYEPPHGSNKYITNPHECKQTLDSSEVTSITVQKEQTLDLSACTSFNRDRIKALIKENMISGKPSLHGIALIQEISARPKSQGIQNKRIGNNDD
ncbi:hypothetical protein Tco_1166433 [Tanacetum coccineum]